MHRRFPDPRELLLPSQEHVVNSLLQLGLSQLTAFGDTTQYPLSLPATFSCQ